jgi:hypothetical protein
MLGMAKKKPTGSRHKDRHQVALPGVIYKLMAELAEEEDRHIRQQVILACKEHLRARGKLNGVEPEHPSDN